MNTSVEERRQHFRIDDHIYFDFRVIDEQNPMSAEDFGKAMLGKSGQKSMESAQYFNQIDQEISDLSQTIALKDPAIAHCLNLLNTKIDYLARQSSEDNQLKLHRVNISLGGMAFRHHHGITKGSKIKMIIYTKPKLIPIMVDAEVVYSEIQKDNLYRIAVQFDELKHDDETLLSQHILQAQIQRRADMQGRSD